MILDLEPIFNNEGMVKEFSYELDLSEQELSGVKPFSTPVRVSGSVGNHTGVVELSAKAEFVLDMDCDRCAKPFLREKEVSWRCFLATEKQNEDNDDIVLLEDGEFVDVEDLARTAFLLEMDTKMLCSQDCKGLCPRCGADLNLGPCFCKKELDPRMAILATLLENEPNE